MASIARQKPLDNPVYLYILKKESEGKPKKVAKIAAMLFDGFQPEIRLMDLPVGPKVGIRHLCVHGLYFYYCMVFSQKSNLSTVSIE